MAVFTPLAFLKGSTGRLFNEFGIAVAGSVIISGFVALTLTPMLCAKILRVPQRHGRLYRVLERGFNRLASRLCPDAGACALRHRGLIVGSAPWCHRGGGVRLPLAEAGVRSAGGSRLVLLLHHRAGGLVAGYTDGYQRRAEAILGRRPRRSSSYFSVVNIGDGVSRGIIFTKLKDWSERERVGPRRS